MDAIFNIIRVPFGYLIQLLYSLANNYLVAILLFSVVLKIVMFPFGIKQQKNSQKQASLRPKENIIRKKYAGRTDKATQMKMNTELQEMYQKENYSPFGGCLPMLIQMLVLIAVYAVVRAPLTFTAKLPASEDFDTVRAVKHTAIYTVYKNDPAEIRNFLNISEEDAKEEKKFFEALEKGNYNYNAEIFAINYIHDHRDAFIKEFDSQTHYDNNGKKVYVGNGLAAEVTGENIANSLPNLELFEGFNLGVTPSLSDISAEQLGRKLILAVPVLTLITSYLGTALTRKFTYQPPQAEETKSQMRMMNIFMPLFSFYISFNVPAAVGIYWMVSNVLSPVQQIALSKMFPIHEITEEEMKEAERLYGGKQKKKKASLGAPKKRSLVYDDDDEYEAVSTAPEKKVLKDKKNTDDANGVIEKAPLKEDE